MTNDLRVSELDFDRIKDNIKLFLENTPELSSYNFTGSALNIMLDLFAYVTHYNAIYGNQQLNETFLDSALLRASVVSRAKELSYIPRQNTAAFFEVDITIRTSGTISQQETFDIPKGITFTGEKDGISIPFITTEQFTLEKTDTDIFSGSIVLRQGEFISDSFLFDSQIENQTFTLTSDNIDTEFLEVEVAPFANSSQRDLFTQASSIIELDETSDVFFWQESNLGLVELFFGDGILGRSLSNGNQILTRSLATLGADGNDVFDIAISESIGSVNRSAITIETNGNSSSGGSGKESIESIKSLAPRLYAVQDRLVTASDYKAYIQANFGNVQSLSVWSGEENVPPAFGRVFISVKPQGKDRLSNFAMVVTFLV